MLEFVTSVNEFMWGFLLLIILVGCGIIFTFSLKFVQLRHIGSSFKQAFGGFSLRGKKAGEDGMSSFQSLATAVAAQVGTGNLAGAATAIVSGGPGAIFWMWLAAFFGMATIFGEAVLAQKFKVVKDGAITGGPAYYLENGLKNKIFGKAMATIFAVLIIIALGFVGNMVQANSVSEAFSAIVDVPSWIIGVILVVMAGFVFIGGIGRIASVTEKVVPLMALIYVIGGFIILFSYGHETIDAFRQIIVGAFNPSAVLGGAAGVTVKQAIRYGVARGLFSNEAGMGSTPHAHAVAKVEHPVQQGFVAMIGVFIDVFVILNMTALIIIVTGSNLVDGLQGINVTQHAFEVGFGHFGLIFIAIALFFFAFSTIVGWYFFGEANIKYLFGNKALMPYRAIVLIFIFLGTLAKVDLVWELADMFNALLVIPNVIGIIALIRLVKESLKDYEEVFSKDK